MKELSLHILDIVQNSIRAQSTRIEITIEDYAQKNEFRILICDNGKGMAPEEMDKALDPFYTSRTTRKVGLGLPLLKQNAKQTGGKLVLSSSVGNGCRVEAVLVNNHIDRQPLGDIAETLVQLFASNPTIRFKFNYLTDKGEFNIDTDEVKQILEDVPITNNKVREFLINHIRENLKTIQDYNQ
ncbi:ATP-binding protein [Prolixibacter sp. SD074]|jgi:hypothetical protein|uniref:ATP-binding protein n=1 Tax=Prolixibacter sp. SD074 TaxID=2652391 RepID=UPI00127641A3|nr:ATP-binding protein [Prolixibacter sp. SD074]GET31111.1 histidine kinase [Prolixibacter sp. SD074]